MLPCACKCSTASIISLLLATSLAPSLPAQPNLNPGIVPIHARSHGKTYGEWGAAWWQWVLGIPWASNPLNDPTGANAANGQSGPVWFLGGTFGGNATRTISVPPGKALFFPIVNWEWDTVPGFGPYPLATGVSEPLSVQDIYALSAFFIDAVHPNDISCEIDGRSVRQLANYRAASPVFSFTFAPDLWGPPYPGPFVETAVTDGYWLLVNPLPAGNHVISFRAHIDAFPPDGPPPLWQGRPAFDLEVTYNITVGP